MRLTKLKLSTHDDNGWMYRVYRNQAVALILPFIFFILLLPISQILKKKKKKKEKQKKKKKKKKKKQRKEKKCHTFSQELYGVQS